QSVTVTVTSTTTVSATCEVTVPPTCSGAASKPLELSPRNDLERHSQKKHKRQDGSGPTATATCYHYYLQATYCP
ncbi:10838_t:CDS:1, partial [Racocetra persica]